MEDKIRDKAAIDKNSLTKQNSHLPRGQYHEQELYTFEDGTWYIVQISVGLTPFVISLSSMKKENIKFSLTAKFRQSMLLMYLFYIVEKS